MLKGGKNSGQITPRGIHVSTEVMGKALKLLYGLVQTSPDLIWYNNWETNSYTSNQQLYQVTGGTSKKKGQKKSGVNYYSAAIDCVLCHAPAAGVYTAWYNNQRLGCLISSASGFIYGGSFTFVPIGGESLVTLTYTVPAAEPYVITVPDFVSDGQTTQNNTGVYDNTLGLWLVSGDPLYPPGVNQYTVDDLGDYTFNEAQAGQSVNISYRKAGGGSPGVLAGILAVTINETIPTQNFNDFGSPGEVTMSGHWDRPLWNRGFSVPGVITPDGPTLRDPYSWSWDGTDPTVYFPTNDFDGYPVTVYYAIPVINNSDGSFYSSSITPLALLGLEFEPACGSGSEYTYYPAQQDINSWAVGVGSIQFDLGCANAMPNMQLEVVGTFTVWPNGDAHVCDVLTDVIMSGPIPPGMVPHGANCNDYDNGGSLNPQFPPGVGLLLGEITESGGSPLIIQPIVPVALEEMHNWCVANGMSVALNQDTQRTAKDIADELATVGNSAPVYVGDTLFLVPYDEISNVGWGAIYVAPTSCGPVAYLTDEDYASDQKNPSVIVTRTRRTDCDNVVSVEFVDRSIDYVQNVVTEHDQMGIALYGPRHGGELSTATLGTGNPVGAKLIRSISNGPVAQKVARVLVQRSAAGVDQFTFELKAEFFWLTAMTLVAVSQADPRLPLNQVPVRLTSVKETSKRTYKCIGDRYVYGLNHPFVNDITQPSGTLVGSGYDPGLVNLPIIFQPPCEFTKGEAKVAFIVSGSNPNYGGCFVYVSIDGGDSYSNQPIAQLGPGTTGYLTDDYPAESPEEDPDTTDTLSVDLTESAGSLPSYSQQIADANLDPMYVSIDAGSPLEPVGFEMVCPTVATLTSAYKYNLTTYIRRAVQGSQYADHPAGSRFAAMNNAMVMVELDPYWMGVDLKFKFAAYNKQGGQTNPLPTCVPYSFTPQPACGDPTYIQNPSYVLSQSEAAQLESLACTEQFSTWQASYKARTGASAMAIPGGAPLVPTWYYLCIIDPSQQGDPDSGFLPVSVLDNDSLVGVVGYTYIGAIKANPDASPFIPGDQVTSGGYPPPPGYQVIS